MSDIAEFRELPPDLDDRELKTLVDQLDPIDWEQLKLIASLPFERRILINIRAQSFAMAAYRGALQNRYPDLPLRKLNLLVLEHFTPLRITKEALSSME